MQRKHLFQFLVPVLVLAVLAGLNLAGVLDTAEQRVYDLFLHIKPSVDERDDILLLDVDDLAIANVGSWPWSRDNMARGLILLREFDSTYVTFDIEYVDDSPRAINADYLQEQIPQTFNRELGAVQENVQSLFQAIASGQIPVSEAGDYVEQLSSLTEQAREELLSAVQGVVRDNDDYLGRAARFHGQAFFTVNILPAPEPGVSAEEVADAKETLGLESVQVRDARLVRSGEWLRPVIPPIRDRAAGAGFPNVIVDNDGVRRRIELVARADETFFAQLVTAPLLDWLGDPRVVVDDDRIVLQDARLPGSSTDVNIGIPLATDGRMLINWPKKTFFESFRHLSYWRLLDHWKTEEDLLNNLETMFDANYLAGYVAGDELYNLYADYGIYDDQMLLALYDEAQAIRDDVLDGGDRAQLATWREFRRLFFEEVGNLLNGEAEAQIIAQLQNAVDSGELDSERQELYQQTIEDIPSWFEGTQSLYTHLMENREVMKEEISGSFVIIGWVGTSTTDIGVNPFEKEYMNVGTHAALLNTILQRKFLDDAQWWLPFAVAAAIALLLTFLIRELEATPSLIIGFAGFILVAAVGVVLFLVTGVYYNMITPLAVVLLTFIVLTIIKFLASAREKTFIRNAFNHYLSTDVINQILDDPARLGLGGVKKDMTALFTDVRGFSSISETLEPDQLVQLLNRYLSEMCDIILEERGTIDKFEGDAIISFWGAPVELTDHAARACRSAIQMKKVEELLNQEFITNNLSPNPLYTRIGINSGEMVVGNMGTATRMDYTMMGHNVNLAARLEGVNKQYGTWILVSEQTYKQTGREFAVRRLDRVRVVGITEPIRLFELIDYRDAINDATIQKLRSFNAGLNAFEEKDFNEAHTHFKQVLNGFPEDGPARYYEERCRKFKKSPPPADWDGVFNLTTK